MRDEGEGGVVFSGGSWAVSGKRRLGMVLFALLGSFFAFALLSDPAWAQTLNVVKSDAGSDPRAVGQDIIYTITVTNTEAGTTAENVTLTDFLPDNTTFRDVTTTPPRDCDGPGAGSSNGTVTCDLGDITLGTPATVTLRVRPTAQAGEVGSVSNTVTVDADNAEEDSDTETTTVIPSGLTITKDDSPDPADVGEALLYTLTIRNNTASPRDIVVEDELPNEVEFLDVDPEADCEETNNLVTCEFDALAVGATQRVRILVEPQEDGTITNNA